MKKILLMALLTSAVTFGAAQADSLPAPVIGIVEQATLDKSEAIKSIVEQLEKKRAEIQKEMASYEKELKDKDKSLVDEQKTLSEKDFAAKRQAFEKRVREVQEKLEVRRAQMELAFEDAKKKVYEAFLKAAEEARKEAGANIIIYKETVVTADPAFDLTSNVLAKLNQALPTVNVVFKSEGDVKKQIQQQQSQPQPQAQPQPQPQPQS
ncbi:MAG: OmpH family outer membrane protein [Alphaproteobacteria bacterium]|nr:OmpH family outer membrane protein [Alphaproteobacteria bacterium]